MKTVITKLSTKLKIVAWLFIVVPSVMHAQEDVQKKENVLIIPGHHWDRVWLQPFEVFRIRHVNMLNHLMEVMEEKPGFKHFTLDGETYKADNYLEIHPDKADELKRLIKEQKVFIGPWYTQPNVFMVSGEAAIRNLYLGITRAQELGHSMDICYLPDAFGVNGQLPQIMKGFNMDEVFFWRGIPKSYQGIFKWKGNDGTEVFAYNSKYTEGNRYINMEMGDTEEGKKSFLESFDAYYKQRPVQDIPISLVLNNRDMQWAIEDIPEKIDLLNERRENLHVEMSHFNAAFDMLRNYYQEHDLEYKTFTGEARDHRGWPIIVASQSTRMDLKIANRKAENTLEKYTEPANSMFWMSGFDYPNAQENHAWYYLIRNQHHDNTAGATHDNDYYAVMAELQRVEEIGWEHYRKATEILTDRLVQQVDLDNREYAMVAFNTLGWKRSGVEDVVIDIPEHLNIRNPVIKDGDKEYTLYPDNYERVLRYSMKDYSGENHYGPEVKRYYASIPLNDLPAMGYKYFKIVDKSYNTPVWQLNMESTLRRGAHEAENELIKLSINSNGTMDIHDKRTGKTYDKVHYFLDEGEAGSGFEHIHPLKNEKITTLEKEARISLVHESPYKIAYKIEWEMQLPKELDKEYLRRDTDHLVPCRIKSIVSLKAGSPRIDIKTTIENNAKDHRLRVCFPTHLDVDKSHAHEPFEVVSRPVPMPEEQYEDEGHYWFPVDESHPMHHFVDLSDGEKGMMIVNKGLTLYEINHHGPNVIELDMVRSLDRIHTGGIGATKDIQIPDAQMIGTYTFEYSIIPHEGQWPNAQKEAFKYVYPAKVTMPLPKDYKGKELKYLGLDKKGLDEMPIEHSFIELTNERIIVSALKKAENDDALILRMYNPSDETVETRCLVRPLEKQVTNIQEVNLMETPVEDGLSFEQAEFELEFEPKKIISLKINMN